MKKYELCEPVTSGKESKHIRKALHTNQIGSSGDAINEFEALMNKLTNSQTMFVNSGTSALHLAYKACGIRSGDIVLVQSLTYVGTVSPLLYEGVEVIFIDSELETWNMSYKALEKAIIDLDKKRHVKPKAVVVVDLYGKMAQYDKIKEVCTRYGILLIEDAAESMGATYQGKPAGTLADIGVYSFSYSKIITAGSGGLIICDDKDKLNYCKHISVQSNLSKLYYEHDELGYNYRPSNINAALALGQMENFDMRIKRKKIIYKTYRNLLWGNSRIKIPKYNSTDSYWVTVVQILDCDVVNLVKRLHERGVMAKVVGRPMHMQPLFTGSKFYTVKKDISKYLSNTAICLPSSVNLTHTDIEHIVEILLEEMGK